MSKEFRFLNPVIIDGENGIIAGHGRVMAAAKLKMEEVPCLEASHLTEAQKKAYILAYNKLAEQATWLRPLSAGRPKSHSSRACPARWKPS